MWPMGLSFYLLCWTVCFDFYLAYFVGSTQTVQERVGGDTSGGNDYNEASLVYVVPNIEREIKVTSSNNFVEKFRSFTEFDVINTYLTRPIISVYDDVSNDWTVGELFYSRLLGFCVKFQCKA